MYCTLANYCTHYSNVITYVRSAVVYTTKN